MIDELKQRIATLSPVERAILERRLQAKTLADRGKLNIPRRKSEDILLSFAQEQMWFLDRLEPGNPAYNRPVNLRLLGQLNIASLEQSLQEIMRRHEVLRSNFPLVQGQPEVTTTAQFILPLPVILLDHLSAHERQEQIAQLATQEAQKSFDLEQDCLIRATLVQLQDKEHILLLTFQHIIFDAWSMEVLLRELAVLYDAFAAREPSPLTELAIQYADFAHWQKQQLQGEEFAQKIAYWKKQLGGELPILKLPERSPRSPVQTFRGTRHPLKISSALTSNLKRLSQENSATLFMTLLTAFQVLLYRYTGQEDIIVGSPIAGRDRLELENLIGVFINTIALRTQLSGNLTFQAVLANVRQTALEAYQYQVPLAKVVEELQPERDLSHTPIFQVLFRLRNVPQKKVETREIKIEEFQCNQGIAPFDLSLDIRETESSLLCIFEYNTDLFEVATIERMVGHFQTLLESIVANPDELISLLPILTAAEQHQLLVEWNNTSKDYPQDRCIHQLFEAQVKRTPDATAVVFDNEQLTYQQLNQRANQLAHYLQALGVGPEVLVGICLEQSNEIPIAMLGVLKAGGAYVPLDPTHPKERLAFMLEDAQVSALLTQAHLVEQLPKFEAQIVCVDKDWQEITACLSGSKPLKQASHNNLAYVIYTSGSTGKPKGVQVPHRTVVNFLTSMQKKPGLTQKDILLSVTTISFDIAVLELFLPLTIGAKTVLVSRQTAVHGEELLKKLRSSGATVMQATPATWRLLLAAGWEGSEHLKVLCGGEALPPTLAKELISRVQSVWNMYGPTETTVWSTCYEMKEPDGAVSIGQPIANTQIYLLDSHQQPVPIGVPGELYIGGAGIVRGYLNRPELTAERFISDPFSQEPNARLYRTGDLVRYQPNGNIEYLGRIDHQVKIRGFRVELGEIEAVLSQHPEVRQTVVIAREDVPGDRRLVAYLVPKQQPALTSSELRCFLKQQLPEYMVPLTFVRLEVLPLTPNGKVDRRALPVLEYAPEESGAVVSPRNLIEEVLVAIWCDVLQLNHLSIHDNFFELGGHSLLATKVISRLREVFGQEIPLRCLFEAPTVAQLSQVIAEMNHQQTCLPLSIEFVERTAQLPLSFAQARLWFLEQLQGTSAVYNIPLAWQLEGMLNYQALEQALNALIARHEILRTTFASGDGSPISIIAPQLTLSIPVTDLQALAATEPIPQVQQLVCQEAHQAFDLVTGPLLRVSLLRLRETSHVLVLTIHHIIADGWSMGVLTQELSLLYQAFCWGEPSPLPDLPIQYADFASWQRQWLTGEVLATQLSYWKQQLAAVPPLLNLPTDRPRTAIQTFAGNSHSFLLSQALSQQLTTLAQASRATLFMTLLAGFAVLLSRYIQATDIPIGSPIANRQYQEIEPLIGFFVNTLLLRVDLSGNPTFTEVLERVRQLALDAYTYQDLPFEKLVAELKPERNLSHLPLFQVMFSLESTPQQQLDMPNLTVHSLEIERKTAKFDLALTMKKTNQGLRGDWEYNTDLFEAATIERMASHFETLLHAIVANSAQPIGQLPLLTEAERHQILDELPVLDLSNHCPLAKLSSPRPTIQTFSGRWHSVMLSTTLTDALKQLAQQEEATLFMVLLTAFKTLLYRHTQQEDILISSPISNQKWIETEDSIGFFVNTLVLRSDLSGQPTFRELLRRVRAVVLAAYDHQDLPFEKLVEELKLDRDLSRHPLAQVMFVLEHAANSTIANSTPIAITTETAKFDLVLSVQVSSQGLNLSWSYNTDLFDYDVIKRMSQHYEILLNSIVLDCDQSIATLPLLTECEKQLLFVEWNQTQTEYPRNACMHQQFEAQVEQSPDVIALVMNEQQLTYRKLNQSANQLANHLRKLGVKPNQPVGVYLERSPKLIIALLAILKAGGAYLPLDPSYPLDRLSFMLEDAEAKILLHDSKSVFQTTQCQVVDLDAVEEFLLQYASENLPSTNTALDLAYVLYTSGSTGKPKGVMVPHRAVMRLVINTNYIDWQSSDVVAQASNCSFDAATFEIWGALLNGARLTIVPKAVLLSPHELMTQLRSQAISVLFLTTAVFHQFAQSNPSAFAALRYLLVGGEVIDPQSVKQVLNQGKPQHFIHVYGPTENTTFSSWYPVEQITSPLPIGRPIANTQIFLLDRHLQPVPIGVPGEVCLGGDGLAQGYLNRPSQSFVLTLINGVSVQLYRTSDRARYRPDGNLEFLGRFDNQIKLRGYRIELGEIEAALKQHPDVQDAIVLMQQHEAIGKFLHAYITSIQSVSPSSLRNFLQPILPDYMIPSAFTILETFPLTPNGKVDRFALQQIGKQTSGSKETVNAGIDSSPANALEVQLIQIWQTVLGIQPLSVYDNFFEVGGHSLLAARLHTQIERILNRKLPLIAVFQAPTVRQMAERLQQEQVSANLEPEQIERQDKPQSLFWCSQHPNEVISLANYLESTHPLVYLDTELLEIFDPARHIQERAIRCLAELKALQPKGPYFLGGFCLGGLVAFEMALHLQAQGEEVLLILVESWLASQMKGQKTSPIYSFADHVILSLSYHCRELVALKPSNRLNYILQKVKRLLFLVSARFRGESLEQKAQQEWAARGRQAIHAYVPQHIYSGQVSFYFSQMEDDATSLIAKSGWEKFVSGNIEVHFVAGDHWSLMREPDVHILSDGLKEAIAQSSQLKYRP